MKIAPPAMSEAEQEEEATPLVIDLMLMGLVHQKAIQQQPGDLPVATVKMEPTLEKGEDQLEPEMELSLVPLATSSPLTSDLVEVAEAGPLTPSVQLIPTPGFQFLADVPLKTPFLRTVQIATAPIIPESSTMTLPQQSPPVSIALPPIEVESQDEFIGELVDGFYNSLKRYLPMIFKSTRTSFAS